MKYSNIVHFKPKPGELENVMEILNDTEDLKGMIHSFVVKTSESTCCSVGIWESEAHIAEARPDMIKILDRIREKLEVLSEELGVTDPYSGPIIQEYNAQ